MAEQHVDVELIIITEDRDQPRPRRKTPPHHAMRIEDLSRLEAHNLSNRLQAAILQFEHELGRFPSPSAA